MKTLADLVKLAEAWGAASEALAAEQEKKPANAQERAEHDVAMHELEWRLNRAQLEYEYGVKELAEARMTERPNDRSRKPVK